MRIAIPVLSLKHHGGTKVLVEIANQLALWADITFLVPKGQIDTTFHISEKVKIRELSTGFRKKMLAFSIFLLRVIWEMRKYDLLVGGFFVCHYSVFLASKLFCKRRVYLVQGVESIYDAQTLSGKLLNALCEFTYREKCAIAANDYLKGELTRRGRPPLYTFTVGVSEMFFTIPKSDEEEKRHYDVLYFARKEYWKNIDLFYAILKNAPDELRWLIVSQDGPLLSTISTSFPSKSIQVTKPRAQDDLIKAFDSSRVFLLTSRREGFAMPPLEAMSRGVPVLTYPCGGPELYTRHGDNGFIYRSDTECNHYINLLLNDSDLHLKMSSSCRETAQEYRMSISIGKLSHFLQTSFAAQQHANS